MSETAKYRHLTRKYCYRADGEPGCGVDLASQGDPVVPWAIQLDLPPQQFAKYCGGEPPKGPIQLRGSARHLPFDSNSMDFVYSSHLLEDFPTADRPYLLYEWTRVLKPGGTLIVLVPERDLWKKALERGQPPNCAHIPNSEPAMGDLTRYAYALKLPLKRIEERLTAIDDNDYSLLGVFQKV